MSNPRLPGMPGLDELDLDGLGPSVLKGGQKGLYLIIQIDILVKPTNTNFKLGGTCSTLILH